jgi:hypothetical protein
MKPKKLSKHRAVEEKTYNKGLNGCGKAGVKGGLGHIAEHARGEGYAALEGADEL